MHKSDCSTFNFNRMLRVCERARACRKGDNDQVISNCGYNTLHTYMLNTECSQKNGNRTCIDAFTL